MKNEYINKRYKISEGSNSKNFKLCMAGKQIHLDLTEMVMEFDNLYDDPYLYVIEWMKSYADSFKIMNDERYVGRLKDGNVIITELNVMEDFIFVPVK